MSTPIDKQDSVTTGDPHCEFVPLNIDPTAPTQLRGNCGRSLAWRALLGCAAVALVLAAGPMGPAPAQDTGTVETDPADAGDPNLLGEDPDPTAVDSSSEGELADPNLVEDTDPGTDATDGLAEETDSTVSDGFMMMQQVVAAEEVGATAGEIGVTPSGSLSYSIPIAVPPGTSGVQPKLSLQYDSQAGNGIAGVGWSVGGLSFITRCPPTLHMDGEIDPIDYDSNDKFCLNGQRLVPISGTYGADSTEYRTTFEEFSRVISYGTAGGGPQKFKVWKKTGEILEYGYTAVSRIEAPGRSDVRVWALNRLYDTRNNYIDLKYIEDSTAGEFRVSEVNYTGNTTQSLLPYNQVLFVYELRPDPIKGFMAGGPMAETRRLTNVMVYAEGALFRDYRIAYETAGTGRSRPVSLTECAANDICFAPTTFQWSPDGPGKLSTISLGTANGITGAAYDMYGIAASGDFNGDGITDVYLVRMDTDGRAKGLSTETDRVWLGQANGTFQTITVAAADSLPVNFVVTATGDFNGDGLTDFYAFHVDSVGRTKTETASDDYVALSLGNGTFQKVVLSTNEQGGITTTMLTGYAVMGNGDFDGDGRTDLFLARTKANDKGQILGDNTMYVLRSNGNGTFTNHAKSGDQYTGYDGYAIEGIGDFSGDGLTDFYLYQRYDDGRAIGSGEATDRVWLAKRNATGVPDFDVTVVPLADSLAADFSIRANGDFNGDGLADIYAHRTDGKGRSQSWDTDWVGLSKGNGTFSRIQLGASSGMTADASMYKVRVLATGDFNGDGLTDVYVAPTKDDTPTQFSDPTGSQRDDFIFLSKGDGTFNNVQLTGSGVNIAAHEYYGVGAIGDFNRDGLTDLYVLRLKADGSRRSNGDAADYIWPSAWSTPDLLATITNGLGLASTAVHKPLTDPTVYTKGSGAAYPVADLIAPSYVVAELKADNGIGGQNTQAHTYATLRAHLQGYGALGFATMTAVDQATGIKTESLYKQDWQNDLVGVLESAKTIAPPANGNTILEDRSIQWQRRLFTTSDGTLLRFIYSPSSTTIKRDLNGALLGTVSEESVYDDFGFPTQVTVTTTEPDNSKTYVKVTVNTYDHHTVGKWLLGRLSQSTVTHQETGVANQVRTSTFTYNTTYGYLTSETIEPADGLFYKKTYTWNVYAAQTGVTESWATGSISGMKKPDGTNASSRATTFAYDAKVRYRTSETNPLGHVETTVYDPVHGLPTSKTGPNGLTTTWQYDAFGRVTLETRADGTTTTTLRQRCGGTVSCPAGAIIKITTTTSGAPQSIVFEDKLYREVRQQTQGFASGSWSTVDTEYDALGRISRKSEPYLAGGTVYWTTITYDILGRPLVTTRPDTSTQSVTYNGLLETSFNELGQKKEVWKDAVGRMVRVRNNANTNTYYVYDAVGQQTSMHRGTTVLEPVTAAYDIRGNVIAETDPDKGSWTYRYNALGLLVEETDAKNQTTIFTFDLLGRPRTRTDADGALTTWTYDYYTDLNRGIGKPRSATSLGYAIEHNYDSLGRPSSTIETIDSVGYTLVNDYDSLGRPAGVTYPSGLRTNNL